MKQKLLAIVLSLILVLGTASLAACGDKAGGDGSGGITVTDTFEGVASETQYDDEETAVKAFLADEIGGKFTSYENKGALNAEKTAELAISDEDKKDIEAVYEVEITYEVSLDFDDEEEDEFMLLAEQSEEVAETYMRTHTAYVIKYKNGKCKYFAPCPKNGEAITRSYFKSLLDSDKYTNCKSVISAGGIGYNEDIYTTKDNYTTTVFESVIKRVTESSRFSQFGEKQYTDTCTDYIFEHENRIYNVRKYEDEYSCVEYFGEWKNLLVAYIFGGNMNYASYVFEKLEDMLFTVEKTATGFKFTDKSMELLLEFGGIIGEDYGGGGYIDVKDGKIVKLFINIWFKSFMGVKGDFNLDNTLDISDFGKIAPIEVPAEYLAEVENAE